MTSNWPDWLIGCLTVRQHRKVNLCQLRTWRAIRLVTEMLLIAFPVNRQSMSSLYESEIIAGLDETIYEV